MTEWLRSLPYEKYAPIKAITVAAFLLLASPVAVEVVEDSLVVAEAEAVLLVLLDVPETTKVQVVVEPVVPIM